MLLNPQRGVREYPDEESRELMLAVIDFFESKGLARIKHDDHERVWYQDFLEFVRNKMIQYNLPPQLFCFEITETSAIANLSTASRFIRELKKMGCLFALDDFGSGLSSFGYLKNLPVDFLKIDGQFVKDIVDDPIDDAMVRSINEIGHVMGMQTIAEFVENEAILNRLKDIGVDFAQGYGVAKPEPLLINEQRKTAS